MQDKKEGREGPEPCVRIELLSTFSHEELDNVAL